MDFPALATFCSKWQKQASFRDNPPALRIFFAPPFFTFYMRWLCSVATLKWNCCCGSRSADIGNAGDVARGRMEQASKKESLKSIKFPLWSFFPRETDGRTDICSLFITRYSDHLGVFTCGVLAKRRSRSHRFSSFFFFLIFRKSSKEALWDALMNWYLANR